MAKKVVVGIICEYDPFHLGHKHQFEMIRQVQPDAAIVCLMSGCFTQRGMPALHMPSVRTAAALDAGADLVLELPTAFSVRDAEHFALGSVSILSRLGFVTHLSFGCENGIEVLQCAAKLLEAPTDAFVKALRNALDAGESFACAQGNALCKALDVPESLFQKPNNILALCYLRALIRLNSPLIPLRVQREGDYHALELVADSWPSATAVRRSFCLGDFEAADAACGWKLPRVPVCLPHALDNLLLYKIRTASPAELALLPDCTEGLENRLHACAQQAISHEQLMDKLKTKRYAYARLNRLCCHALLGMTRSLLQAHPTPEYVRLLGLRCERRELTALLAQSAIPVVAKAADGDRKNELFRLDMHAYDLWALGSGQPAGLMLRQGVRTR